MQISAWLCQSGGVVSPAPIQCQPITAPSFQPQRLLIGAPCIGGTLMHLLFPSPASSTPALSNKDFSLFSLSIFSTIRDNGGFLLLRFFLLRILPKSRRPSAST
ncbi:hypothetical protein CDAR_43491 [Caerostris darwini]|uniref:Uncharacterized protein n=1 Tax=Caerostris darwini TaxID=1538125 RepID=A0AAV4WJ86_9ARAC|nr:hypothetical protein CDAR_43491 [Caerostris darwini]